MTKAKSRRGYVDWPRRDETQATDARPRPQRGRKDTRRWCRGKVGVEHVVETRVNKHATYRVERGVGTPSCYRAEWWPSRWWCNHEVACVNCGKILVVSLEDDCPDRTDEVTVHRRRTT